MVRTSNKQVLNSYIAYIALSIAKAQNVIYLLSIRLLKLVLLIISSYGVVTSTWRWPTWRSRVFNWSDAQKTSARTCCATTVICASGWASRFCPCGTPSATIRFTSFPLWLGLSFRWHWCASLSWGRPRCPCSSICSIVNTATEATSNK